MDVDEHDGLDGLRQRFPEWHFGAVWTAACSGPDRRRLVAYRGPVILSAWDAPTLAHEIEQEKASQ